MGLQAELWPLITNLGPLRVKLGPLRAMSGPLSAKSGPLRAESGPLRQRVTTPCSQTEEDTLEVASHRIFLIFFRATERDRNTRISFIKNILFFSEPRKEIEIQRFNGLIGTLRFCLLF